MVVGYHHFRNPPIFSEGPLVSLVFFWHSGWNDYYQTAVGC